MNEIEIVNNKIELYSPSGFISSASHLVSVLSDNFADESFLPEIRYDKRSGKYVETSSKITLDTIAFKLIAVQQTSVLFSDELGEEPLCRNLGGCCGGVLCDIEDASILKRCKVSYNFIIRLYDCHENINEMIFFMRMGGLLAGIAPAIVQATTIVAKRLGWDFTYGDDFLERIPFVVFGGTREVSTKKGGTFLLPLYKIVTKL